MFSSPSSSMAESDLEIDTISPSSSIAKSDFENDSMSPSSSVAEFYSEIGSKTHDESIVLIKSVEEVRLYLDERFGKKQYIYHNKVGKKRSNKDYYYAVIKCPRSGIPRRVMVKLLLTLLVVINI